jgi:hypothetical protein
MVIMPYEPYVPQSASELLDFLAHMFFASPTFKDKTGYLPRENIDTTFYSLNEGLLVIRKKLGEERYETLKTLSDKMQALFRADPEDKSADSRAGRLLIREMEGMLIGVAKREAPE